MRQNILDETGHCIKEEALKKAIDDIHPYGHAMRAEKISALENEIGYDAAQNLVAEIRHDEIYLVDAVLTSLHSGTMDKEFRRQEGGRTTVRETIRSVSLALQRLYERVQDRDPSVLTKNLIESAKHWGEETGKFASTPKQREH